MTAKPNHLRDADERPSPIGLYWDTRLLCTPRLLHIQARHGDASQSRASLVWLAILEVNAAYGCEGNLAPAFADVGFLAGFCPAREEAEIREVIGQLSAAHLVELASDGALRIKRNDARKCRKVPAE